MTCQHCQTWILDDDHRCRRCGRRVRVTPSRISPATYPIAATATAPAYDFEPEVIQPPAEAGPAQQPLFAGPGSVPRVIPFDSLTSPAERDAIRQRAAETQRPTAVRSARIDAKRPRAKRNQLEDQRPLEFQEPERLLSGNASRSLCDAPVATAGIRVQAALIDTLLMAAGCLPGVCLFVYAGGSLPLDRHAIPFLALAMLTVPLLYKLLWALAGNDSPGVRAAGLELVDFDGKRPSKAQRYGRLFGSGLSFLAAGVGMLWALIDEDKLTWHDHMSGTFPTFLGEN